MTPSFFQNLSRYFLIRRRPSPPASRLLWPYQHSIYPCLQNQIGKSPLLDVAFSPYRHRVRLR
uniref:Uncharacterized protein n=1 Tax=Utricularia reniformis TaxID=192314 RepID=A0A1Y0B190_9LAMI|nr:hypothetical protein AEK19_MT0922 [Utricularia reniformis]ART31148.1 hypothetical protein AEK19_MT0922 [Utricularia reniformis]